MQEVLSCKWSHVSHARGSVIRVGEVMQEYLSSGARGSMV